MKMPQPIDSSMIAPCGINCNICDVHLQDKKSCHSCLKACGNKPAICENCNIATCARSQGLSYCYDCAEYPCSVLENMDLSFKDKYQVSMIAQSNLLKEIGMISSLDKS